MDTKGVITLIFVILILAVGLAVAISKYIQQKKKYQDYTFSKFIADYGANVLALLKDVYTTYIKDTSYTDENELIKDLVDHGIDTISDQFAKYDIDSDVMKILSDDMVKEIITKVAIEFKDQIINAIDKDDENKLEPNEVPRETEENYYSPEEEPEVIEEVSKEEAEEMINLTNEFKSYLNEEDYKYTPAESEDTSDTVDV